MKDNRTRTIAFLLTLLMAASVLGSCGEAKNDPKDTTAPANVTTAADTTTEASDSDNLPTLDLGGREFNVLIREEVSYEFDADQTGDLVNDAVYERNVAVSERFNLNINYISAPGLWASKGTYQALISNAVLANDATYDIVTGQSNIIIPMAAQGLYNEVQDSEYIDFSKPYWKSGYHDNVMIDGKLYTLCGDYALTALTCSNVIFFNKSLMDQYDLAYPYELVRTGKWTLDEFLKLVSDMAIDLNGDSVIDVNDLHGFAAYNNSIQPIFYSTGLSITKPDSNGIQQINFPTDTATDVFDRIYAFCNSNSFINTQEIYKDAATTEDGMAPDFKNGKFLMMGMILEGVEKLRDMDVDFGILPYPKYDDKQENYYTSVLRRFTIAAIPLSASDPDMSELLLEALASEGYNKIVPTYYDIALKGKYARDDESSDMLDIISTSSWFDFADAYYTDLGISDFFAGYVLGNSEGMASKFEQQRGTLQANIDKLYEAYANN